MAVVVLVDGVRRLSTGRASFIVKWLVGCDRLVSGRNWLLSSSIFAMSCRNGVDIGVNGAGDSRGGRRHGIDTKTSRVGVDRLKVRDPSPEVILGDVQNLSCSLGVRVSRVRISGHNGRVINEVEQLSCILGQKDLLLGTLDDGGSVSIVGLLELLTGDVGKLSFSDE